MGKQELDVLIALPSHDGTYKFQMMNAYERLITHSQREGVRVGRKKMVGSLLPNMRCYLAGQALEVAKYVFFIDSDQVLPPDALVKLMSHKKKIISGMYFKKVYPYNNVASVRNPDSGKMEPITKWPEGDLFQVDACGAGCLLIETKALKGLSRPWFSFYEDSTAAEGQHGEDYYFCKKAKAAGYPIFVDPTVQCGHVGDYVFTVGEYKAARAQIAQQKMDAMMAQDREDAERAKIDEQSRLH